jgi:hypothetical protein
LIPFIGTVALNLFKMVPQRRLPSLDDANDTGLDLVVTSIISVASFHKGTWEVENYEAAITIDIVVFAFLLVLRAVRQADNEAHLLAGQPITPVGKVGYFELILGLLAAIITVM